MRLWDFCEQFYGDKRIELLCLDLQNRYGVNVGIVLWLCWLSKIDRFVSGSVFAQVKSQSLSFHESFVNPVRDLRKNARIKSFDYADPIIRYLLNAEVLLERELLEKIELSYADSLNAAPDTDAYGLVDYLQSHKVIDVASVVQFLYAGAKSVSSV